MNEQSVYRALGKVVGGLLKVGGMVAVIETAVHFGRLWAWLAVVGLWVVWWLVAVAIGAALLAKDPTLAERIK